MLDLFLDGGIMAFFSSELNQATYVGNTHIAFFGYKYIHTVLEWIN